VANRDARRMIRRALVEALPARGEDGWRDYRGHAVPNVDALVDSVMDAITGARFGSAPQGTTVLADTDLLDFSRVDSEWTPTVRFSTSGPGQLRAMEASTDEQVRSRRTDRSDASRTQLGGSGTVRRESTSGAEAEATLPVRGVPVRGQLNQGTTTELGGTAYGDQQWNNQGGNSNAAVDTHRDQGSDLHGEWPISVDISFDIDGEDRLSVGPVDDVGTASDEVEGSPLRCTPSPGLPDDRAPHPDGASSEAQ
jgi:hypothetical protein